jgi:hypothetical protein
VLFQQLEKERQTLRKRAITALGHLTDVVSDEQFQRIIERMLSAFAKNPDSGAQKTFILTSIAVCRASPGRLARFLSQASHLNESLSPNTSTPTLDCSNSD